MSHSLPGNLLSQPFQYKTGRNNRQTISLTQLNQKYELYFKIRWAEFTVLPKTDINNEIDHFHINRNHAAC